MNDIPLLARWTAGRAAALAAAGLLLLCLWPRPLRAAKTFSLTRDGRAMVDIIYQDDASDYPIPPAAQRERFAECLADFVRALHEISGAEVKAFRAGDAPDHPLARTIQIGPTPAAVQAGLVKKAGALKPHALLIRSDADRQVLYLLGSTLEGAGHAMYQLLENLGCRWYYPGPEGEELPALPTIELQSFETARTPAFEYRAMQLTNTSQFARTDAAGRRLFEDWMRRNRFGGWAPPRGHSFPAIVGKQFAAHPEYYALRNGKRVDTHLCMSNPATVTAAVDCLTDLFRKNPEMRGTSVALADGTHYCECPACTKACGGDPKEIMDLYLDFLGQVFSRVEKNLPGRELQYGTYIYANLMRPPTRPAPKQLAPYFAPLGYDPFHSFLPPSSYRQLSVYPDFSRATLDLLNARPTNYLLDQVRAAIEGWGQGSSNLYLRDYDPYITFQQNLPVFRTYQLAIELPWYRQHGVRGFVPEACGQSWFASGLNYWMRSRLYWDVGLDVRAELTEMCRRLYGPAWEPMYGFFDALSRRTLETEEIHHGDDALPRLYSIEFARGLDPYLRRAEALADTAKRRARVRMWRLCQQHLLAYLQVREAEAGGRFVDAAALCRDYLKLVDYIESVNPVYLDHRWYAEREFSLFTKAGEYEKLAARQNGADGTLLTALPLHWYFKHDPRAAGVAERWQAFPPEPAYVQDPAGKVAGAGLPMPGWELRRTSEPWQQAPADYEGFNWYRTQAMIPESARGKPVRLAVTGIFGHMDFFVNGRRVSWTGHYIDKDGRDAVGLIQHLDLGTAWSWNYNEEFDVDVSAFLEPGAVNTFAIRSIDVNQRGGIFKAAFLYVPAREVAAVYSAPQLAGLDDLPNRPRCACRDGHAF